MITHRHPEDIGWLGQSLAGWLIHILIGAGAGKQKNYDEEKGKKGISFIIMFLIFADLGEPSLGGDLPPMRPGNIRGCFNAPLAIRMII